MTARAVHIFCVALIFLQVVSTEKSVLFKQQGIHDGTCDQIGKDNWTLKRQNKCCQENFSWFLKYE